MVSFCVHAITITSQTLMPVRVDRTFTLEWEETAPAMTYLMVYDASGNLVASKREDTSNKIAFVPQQEGIVKPGMYTFKLENETESSSPRSLIIDSNVALRCIEPKGAISLLRPRFVWEERAEVPYYHIIVTDQKPELIKDTNGLLTWKNISIVWQAITPSASLAYGDDDPSGYFRKQYVPELIAGKTYAWYVLKNYTGHPMGSSPDIGGITTFTYDGTSESLTLVYPSEYEEIKTDTYTFRWGAKTDATEYRVAIYQVSPEVCSTTTYDIRRLVWYQSTSDTTLTIPCASFMAEQNYECEVVGIAPTKTYIAKRTRFYYTPSTTTAKITITESDRSVIPRGRIIVKRSSTEAVSDHFYSDPKGMISLVLIGGEYTISTDIPGYEMQQETVALVPTETKDVPFVLAKNTMPITLSVNGKRNETDSESFPLFGVEVELVHNGSTTRVQTDLQGLARINCMPGSYTLTLHAQGYSTQTHTVIVDSAQSLTYTLLQSPVFVTGTVSSLQGILSGVKVSITASGTTQTILSDSQGIFHAFVPAGTIEVYCEKEGYIPYTSRIYIASLETSIVLPAIILASAERSFNGVVRSSDSLLGESTVFMRRLATGEQYANCQNVSGALTVPVKKLAWYTFHVVKEGYIEDSEYQYNSEYSYDAFTVGMSAYRSLTLYVTDAVTGVPIAGVACMTPTQIVFTDAQGRALLYAQKGTMNIVFSYPEYASVIETVGITDMTTQRYVMLSRIASSVRGTIHTSDGFPVGSTTVVLQNATARFGAYTDSNGQFFMHVPAGTYSVSLEDRYQGFTTSPTVTVLSNQSTTLPLLRVATKMAHVKGKVINASGSVMKNVLISARDPEGEVRTYSATNGQYSFFLKKGVEYSFAYTFPGYAPYSITRVITDDVSVSDTVLRIGYNVTMSVEDTAHNPIAYAQIVAIKGADRVEGQTDAKGVATLYLERGTYTLTVTKSGYTTHEATINVTTVLDLDPIVLSDTRVSLQGLVRDASGTPIPNVLISIPVINRSIKTASDGTFTLSEIPQGTYAVTLQARGYRTRTINVTANGVATLNAILNELANQLTVRSEGGAGFNMSVSGAYTNERTTTTNTVVYQNQFEGTVILTPRAEGFVFQPESLQVTLGPDETRTVVFNKVAITQSVQVTVTESGGTAPVGDATVTLHGYSGTITAPTNSEGIALFTGIAPGRYTLRITALGFDESTSILDIPVVSGTYAYAHSLTPQYGTLTLTSTITPYTYTIFSDNKIILSAETTLTTTSLRLAAGSYTITVAHPEYAVETYIETIEKTKTLTREVLFTQPKQITIIARPITRSGDIYLSTQSFLWDTEVTTTDGKKTFLRTDIRVEPTIAGTLNAVTQEFIPDEHYIGPVIFTFSVPGYTTTLMRTISLWGVLTTESQSVMQSVDGISLTVPAGALSNPVRVTLQKGNITHGSHGVEAYTLDTTMYTLQPFLSTRLPISLGRTPAMQECFGWDMEQSSWTRFTAQQSPDGRVWHTSYLHEWVFASASRDLSVQEIKIAPNPYSGYVSPLTIAFRGDSRESSWLRVSVKLYTMDGAFVTTLVNDRIVDKGYQTITIGQVTSLKNGRYVMLVKVSDGKHENVSKHVFVVMQ